MSDKPTFEDATDRFLGMTKSQFAMVSVMLSLIAACLASVSIGFWAWSTAQRRHDFCVAVDTTNAAIRRVLSDGIKTERQELKDPKFAKYRKEILRSIHRSEQYKAALFANHPC